MRKIWPFVVIGLFMASAMIPAAGAAILPGFDSEQNALYGYQPNGKSVSQLNTGIPTPIGSCGYNWLGTATPAAGTVRAQTAQTIFGIAQPCGLPGQSSDDLNIVAQQNLVLANTVQQVNYYINNTGTNKVTYVTGYVQNYTYTISLQIAPSSNGAWDFAGDTIWLAMGYPKYNQAITDPNNGSVSGPAFQSPLYGVVEKAVWSNIEQSSCSLCNRGDSLAFYSSANAQGSPIVTWTQNLPPNNLNLTLSSSLAPDSRMQSTAYYPLTIEHLQNDCSILGSCHAPSVTITFHLYTLQIGKFLLTNPDKVGVQPPPNPSCTGNSIGCAISDFFGHLIALIDSIFATLNKLGPFITALFVIVVLAAVTLPLIFILIYLNKYRKG